MTPMKLYFSMITALAWFSTVAVTRLDFKQRLGQNQNRKGVTFSLGNLPQATHSVHKFNKFGDVVPPADFCQLEERKQHGAVRQDSVFCCCKQSLTG